jgi:hypothetical protein
MTMLVKAADRSEILSNYKATMGCHKQEDISLNFPLL